MTKQNQSKKIVRPIFIKMLLSVIVVVSIALFAAPFIFPSRPKVSPVEIAWNDMRKVRSGLLGIAEDHDKAILTIPELKALAAAPTEEGVFVSDLLTVIDRDKITYHNIGAKLSSLKPNNPLLSMTVHKSSGESVILTATVGGKKIISDRIPEDGELLQ